MTDPDEVKAAIYRAFDVTQEDIDSIDNGYTAARAAWKEQQGEFVAALEQHWAAIMSGAEMLACPDGELMCIPCELAGQDCERHRSKPQARGLWQVVPTSWPLS